MSASQKTIKPGINDFFVGLFFALSARGFRCFDFRQGGERLIASALERLSNDLPKLGTIHGVDVSSIVPSLRPHPAYGTCRAFDDARSVAHLGGTIYFRSDQSNRWYIKECNRVPKWIGLPEEFCLAVADEFMKQIGSS